LPYCLGWSGIGLTRSDGCFGRSPGCFWPSVATALLPSPLFAFVVWRRGFIACSLSYRPACLLVCLAMHSYRPLTILSDGCWSYVRLPWVIATRLILARGRGLSPEREPGIRSVRISWRWRAAFSGGILRLESAFCLGLPLSSLAGIVRFFSSTSPWVFPARWLSCANPATTDATTIFQPHRFEVLHLQLLRDQIRRESMVFLQHGLSITRRAKSGIHRRVQRSPRILDAVTGPIS